jgi:hypothetical protein
MILKIFSPKNLAKILAFFAQTIASFDHNIGFEKNANFFCRKLAKIAETSDHNIDPGFLWKKSPNALQKVTQNDGKPTVRQNLFSVPKK